MINYKRTLEGLKKERYNLIKTTITVRCYLYNIIL